MMCFKEENLQEFTKIDNPMEFNFLSASFDYGLIVERPGVEEYFPPGKMVN